MDSSVAAPRTAVVTVTTDAFLPGTLVLIDSFLQHHPGFEGEIVVLHDALAAASVACLQCWEPVRLVPISAPLQQRLDRLVAACPRLAPLRARFFSLDAFRLHQYDQVLFCDSDLLFRGAIDALWADPDPLLAVGDGLHYEGGRRHRTTFAPLPEDTDTPAASVLASTFNTGVLRIGAALLTEDHHAALLDALEPDRWQAIETAHTDQVVLNRYFEGQVTHVGSAYNYLLNHGAAIAACEGTRAHQAHVLHFAGYGQPKPWQAAALLPDLRHNPTLLWAVQRWYEAYAALLPRLHLANRPLRRPPAP